MRKIKYDKLDNRNVKTKLDWLRKCKWRTKKGTAKTKHGNDFITYHRTKQIYTNKKSRYTQTSGVHYLGASNTKEF